jgi:hypothetical protein
MYFYIFCGVSVWLGVMLFAAAVLGLNSAQAGEDQLGRFPIKWAARVGLFFIVLGTVFAIGGPANAQVVMWPGQEIRFCNGIGAISGGGIVCKHNIYEERIEINHMNRAWFMTFWGAGTAASLLPPLCRISNVHLVTETVFEPGLVRVRTIPCSTGKSGPWIVVEVPES